MSRQRGRSSTANAAWRAGAFAGLAAVALGLVGLGTRPPEQQRVPRPTVAGLPRAERTRSADSGSAVEDGGSLEGRNPAAPETGEPCGRRATGSVPAEEATKYVDQSAAVEFRVARTFDSGKVTFLNSQDPYEGHFYVAIFPDDYIAFPAPPAEHFDGKCVVVQGRVELYRGTPQIVLRVPEDIVVVGD